MTAWQVIRGIFTDRVPGEGYFAGAEGFIRLVIFIILGLAGWGIYALVV